MRVRTSGALAGRAAALPQASGRRRPVDTAQSPITGADGPAVSWWMGFP